ncbi:hypothetical protein Tco_0591956 [Tanacetum coccineum]
MISDHNSSDLAPQRQEMSVENVSSGLVPQGQKASNYDNSGPVPPRQNVVPPTEKTDAPQQGLEFLFSALLEEYYNPTHGQAEENNNDQVLNASFQEDEFINPFCTRVQEIGEPSSHNIDNTDVHSFQPQSHDYRWTRDHPLEQVRGNPTMPVQTRRQLATDPEMCMFALTVSIVEPKNIKEAMADSAWIEAMQDELHQFDRLKVMWMRAQLQDYGFNYNKILLYDSSKSRTSNVNVVCAECGKCVFNSNHDACVSRYLNDVNARTKKPNVVLISASKPKRKTNKSIATPHKKTVAIRSH